ncbi:Zn-finger domain-containing protein [Encephalitozoon hellem ATCC 50504]|uniref:Zn-finger domain-containing protein n=1 Tax=Encephalitozoon hellem TaxID=27973 RepID=A0A9Q9C927_ENCHE|nr:Zn-finger domain-containing protein [Encephalitozoon hellem ATCC 50504]AFM98754.1 Zn-finger domain-containing protein [Encephalitozoon hellem ATCC 50504]UTX43730.1 Zn-finger domain-containing protein [Encephalitozoon hellem]|eukprot:XP_003887735.1 Zn-finger domain-containing protein [Encephalitozoon hellem ATCC 50504]
MKQGTGQDLRLWVEGVVSKVSSGTDINEVLLPDGRTKIYVYFVSGRVLFNLSDLVSVFECFGVYVSPSQMYECMRSAGYVEKLERFGDFFGDQGLEVVCSDAVSIKVLEKTESTYSGSRPSCPEDTGRVLSGPKDPLEEYKFEAQREGFGGFHNVKELYPFNYQWTDSIMDGILKNIYTSDGKRADSSAKKERPDSVKPGSRGRHMKHGGSLKDRPFVCTYSECKRAFKRYEHLKRHNLMHTGERPHKCKFPGCSKAFSRSDNLSQHYKVHTTTTEMHAKSYGSYRYLNKEFN